MKLLSRTTTAALVMLLAVPGAVVPLAATHQTVRTDPAYLIDTWETEDGLPENSATAMVQTPDGYLWFGTFKIGRAHV
jgi:ligand-binding sensor domain-containing protein